MHIVYLARWAMVFCQFFEFRRLEEKGRAVCSISSFAIALRSRWECNYCVFLENMLMTI